MEREKVWKVLKEVEESIAELCQREEEKGLVYVCEALEGIQVVLKSYYGVKDYGQS